MGFNTWNNFGCDIDEQLIHATADQMVELGLARAGYTYLNLDDCWHSRTRGADGNLRPDPRRFPSGLKALGDHLHSKGLLFGIYSDSGLFTCQGYPGSLGHEDSDAQLWASVGVDYLKYDNCFASSSDVVQRYSAMRDALNRTGRPILYSMCDWGVADPWVWGPGVGHSWRTDADITPSWEAVLRSLDNGVAGLARFAGPGGWNDPDMLEVGNGKLSVAQQRAHFALWALAKAPLLIGCDLRNVSATSLGVLLARELISVHQDALGVAGDVVWKEGPHEVWAAPLAGGGRAVVMFNRNFGAPAATLRVTWRQLGYPAGREARVRDMYGQRDLGTFADRVEAVVEPHGVAALRVTPARPAPGDEAWRPWHGEEAAALQAAARAAARAARVSQLVQQR